MAMQNCSLFAAAVVSLITAATTLLLQLMILANNNGTNEALLLFKAESENRFTALEIQNRNQNEEIDLLKIENLEMRNEMKKMNKKLNNAIIAWNSDDGPKSASNIDFIIAGLTNRPERPAQLLPLQLMSWECHINHILNRLNFSIFMMYVIIFWKIELKKNHLLCRQAVPIWEKWVTL